MPPPRRSAPNAAARRPAAADPDSGGQVMLPQVPIDAGASLRISAIDVWCAGRMYAIPAMSATAWLEVLWAPGATVDDVFPGLAGQDATDEVTAKVLAGALAPADVVTCAYEVLEAAGGRAWWIVLRLVSAALGAWDRLGGGMWDVMVHAERMSLSLWLDVFYTRLVERVEPKKVLLTITQIIAPPPGYESVETNEGADFMAAMKGM